MPLQDHFHPPLSHRRHWHAFHNAWATFIAAELNQHLPEGYFAEANVQFGIEIDVAGFAEDGSRPAANGGWVPPAPTVVVPFTLATDIIEVQVFHSEGGPVLAGAVELVSPANKDRASHRNAFVSKCAAYLHEGVGLVVVDIVTERRGNLHDELLARVGSDNAPLMQGDLYAVAYQPVDADGPKLNVWPQPLTLGQSLPTLPFWLRGGPCMQLDLERTYARTCEAYRLSVNGDR
jgi:hypothetical protein